MAALRFPHGEARFNPSLLLWVLPSQVSLIPLDSYLFLPLGLAQNRSTEASRSLAVSGTQGCQSPLCGIGPPTCGCSIKKQSKPRASATPPQRQEAGFSISPLPHVRSGLIAVFSIQPAGSRSSQRTCESPGQSSATSPQSSPASSQQGAS